MHINVHETLRLQHCNAAADEDTEAHLCVSTGADPDLQQMLLCKHY